MKKTVKLLLCCTNSKPYLYGCYAESDGSVGTVGGFGYDTSYCSNEDEDCKDRTINLNGYVVAEAECDLIEEIKITSDKGYWTNTLDQNNLLIESCLRANDLDKYIYLNSGYAIHLKNVNPFEKPKKLSEYYHWRTERKAIRSLQFTYPPQNSRTTKNYISISSVPKNMCYADEIIVYPTYIENNFTGYEEYCEKCVLISFKPQELCKILNGEKTIEIRKNIVNLLKGGNGK